jgi:ParB family chromosome partitioning protein
MPQAIVQIAIDSLMPDPAQPRKAFLKEEIERLAASIHSRGILQPLRVQRDEERQCWRIVIGECRWRAARLAGLTTVPCLEIDGDVDEVEVLADQVIENTIRNSLRPLELARSLAKLKALKSCNSQALAKEFGLSGAAITRAEALLSLPTDVQELVDDGRVPESAAYEISRLPDAEAKRGLAMLVAGKKLNRDQLQDAVRDAVGKRNVSKGGRLACKLDGGVFVTVVRPGQSLTRADVTAAIERLRKEMKRFEEGVRSDLLQVP